MANTENMHPVQQARKQQGLNREGLAFKAGVTVRTIERIEAAQVMPHEVTKRSIARVLGTTPSDLWPEQEAAA